MHIYVCLDKLLELEYMKQVILLVELYTQLNYFNEIPTRDQCLVFVAVSLCLISLVFFF